MCINPGRLPDGQEIACRKCWQCRNNRVNDWVGRCIAESKTALASSSIELTYGRDEYGSADHPSAVVLTYSDVQKYFKLLRRHGYPCRYFAVGEYGSKKGRAHWHLVVFWLKRIPPFAGFSQYGKWSKDHQATRFMHQRIDEKTGEPVKVNGEPAYYWPHGWTYVEPVSYASVRYKTKYILKDMGEDERQGHLSMSKKPPLGTEWFKRRAEKLVDAGLAPRDLFYGFDEARTRTGQKVRFQLSGRVAEIFLEHFVLTWAQRRPGRLWPRSELVDQFVDPELSPDQLEERLKDHKFEREWAERIEYAKKVEYVREHHSIGGIWNSAKYRRLSDGEKE